MGTAFFYQNIDGGKSLDSVLNAVPKFVRSMRIPLNRNDRIRYTGRIDEKIFERAVRIGMSVMIVPTTKAISVTNSVYRITCRGSNSVLEIRKQMTDTIGAGNVNTATWMRPK